MAGSTVSMKLLIDSSGKRVLFAEARKECVDFLYYILSLPVATIIRLLSDEGMEGSLPTLYKSLENLNDDYIEPNKNKETYLIPITTSPLPLLGLGVVDASTEETCSWYGEEGYCSYHTRTKAKKVSECSGLVKGVVTYMVMDDLEIKPMSTISSITLLSDFGIKNVGALNEKVVNLGMKEAIKLLKISLQSKNVLTELFC